MTDVRAVLAQIAERAEKAGAELDRLTESRGPAANWRWSIPANPERDSDLLIGASQTDVPRLVKAVELVLAEADALDELADQSLTRDGVVELHLGARSIRKAVRDALTPTEETTDEP